MADIPAASAARVEQGFTQVGVLLTSRVTKTQHDTDLAGKAGAVRINGVTYNAANGIVDAGTIAGGGGGTSTVAGLTDASTVGKQVMTAATAAAARSALGAADTASIAALQTAKADAASTPTKTQTVSSVTVSGSTMTIAKADGTSTTATLPSGGTGGGTPSTALTPADTAL